MASDRPTGGAHDWLKSAVGRAAGSELRTRKALIRLDFIEQKSERSVMPQDTGVGRNVVLDGLDFASSSLQGYRGLSDASERVGGTERVEARIRCKILNTMTALGMPDSEMIG